jgi:ribonuclease HI
VNEYEIYVDGSYIDGATGYGLVVLKRGTVVEEIFGSVAARDVDGTRQVAGELVAVKEALKWCHNNLVTEITIYFDYLGIEKWVTGEWKAKQPLTREYAEYVRNSGVKIRWRKVDSHTGNRWNDRADALAKQGTISPQIKIPKAERSKTPLTDSNQGAQKTNIVDNDLMGELTEKVSEWLAFLGTRDIDAKFDKLYNEQFARVFIEKGGRTVGVFDLYNTKKKRFSPYIHDFKDQALKRKIEGYWAEFF